MPARDCPMCGDAMRLVPREVITRTPGTSQTTTAKFREWICPECEYFEEAEEMADRGGDA